MKLLIGHVGEPLAGKETVSKIIAERAKQDGFSVGWLQFRDPLQETLQIFGALNTRDKPAHPHTYSTADRILKEVWDINATPEKVWAFIRLMNAHFDDPVIVVNRSNLQKLAVVMRAPFGANALSHAVFIRVNKRTEDIVQADGVRWLSDEEEHRRVPGAIMLYTTADECVRFKRMQIRRREGEAEKTFEQFLAEENAENERYIKEIGTRADARIDNNHDLFEPLRRDVEKFYATHVLPRMKVAGTV